MFTTVTAAVSVTALVVVLTGIGTLLLRASRWPDPTRPHRHTLADHPDGNRPRTWDEIPAPISAPPVPEEPTVDLEPIDELDPRWDWRAYAEAAERELVAA